jgi:NADH dehydrogenase
VNRSLRIQLVIAFFCLALVFYFAMLARTAVALIRTGSPTAVALGVGVLILPVVGAETKFQPVYVDDVAQAAVRGVLGEAAPGVYELGGPDVHSFRALMQKMLQVVQRRRLIVNIPFFVARIMGGVFDLLQALTLGLFTNGLITRDQVRNLARDNVVSPQARGLSDLGIAPTPIDAVLPEYLWRYRPSGQYAAIKDSAKNLRKT